MYWRYFKTNNWRKLTAICIAEDYESRDSISIPTENIFSPKTYECLRCYNFCSYLEKDSKIQKCKLPGLRGGGGGRGVKENFLLYGSIKTS